MGKISHHLQHFTEKHPHDIDKMTELQEMIGSFFDHRVYEKDYDMYVEFKEELEDFVYELTDEIIIETASYLKRKDGFVGPKWSREEVESVAKQFDAENKVKSHDKEYCPILFWFAMNYAYATHSALNKTISVYIDLAVDELTDKNICIKDKIREIHKRNHKYVN
jgi:recombinational DNA repair protein RecT